MKKVIDFKSTDYNTVIRLWQSKLFPIIEKIKEQYSVLNIGVFDQAAFEDIIHRGLSTTREKYSQLVEEDLKQFKSQVVTTVAMNSVDKLLQPLEQSRIEFHDTANKISYTATTTIDIRLGDVKIIDEKPVLELEQIEKRYQIIIDNEEKEQLYEKMQKVTKAWNDLRDFVNQAGYDTGRYPFFGYGGFIHVSDGSKLEMNPDGINALDNVKRIEQAGNRL